MVDGGGVHGSESLLSWIGLRYGTDGLQIYSEPCRWWLF